MDQAPLRPDFLRFRTDLIDSVRRRDEAALLRVVAPDIRLSFGDENGIDTLRQRIRSPDPDEGDFWATLEWVLAHGGAFTNEERTTFFAPYVFTSWPDAYDAFTCKAVVGEHVRLRVAPSLTGPVVTLLTHAIVEDSNEPVAPGWTAVRLNDGRRGYVATKYLHSPIDYRASFALIDGRWRMNAFIAGD